MTTQLISSALLVFVLMNLMFLLAQWLRNNSIIDIFWGLGFIIITASLLLNTESITHINLIVSFVIFLWGIRLSMHIFRRNKGKPEDFRYANWRRTWKNFLLRSYLQVFMLQGFMMFIIAIPIIISFSLTQHLNPVLFSIGLILFCIGFLFEAISDYQMEVFKKSSTNKGKLITTGLWKISRHPNYFGESLLWWGIWLITFTHEYWWLTIISPLTITILLRYISGVPMLEEKYKNHPSWNEYAKKTPVFFPRIK